MEEPIIGKRFGKWIVKEELGKDKKHGVVVKCICDCGNEKNILLYQLRTGRSKSCGCIKKENAKKLFSTHGLSKTQIFRVWLGIKKRTDHNSKWCVGNYKKFGIKMCDEWKNDFKAFYDWSIENGYKEEKLPNGMNKWTIDRIDNRGDYCPENCRWATNKEQMNNQTTNRMITYKGKTQTLSQWCDELGLRYSPICQRLFWGWSVERAFTEKVGRTRYYEYKGEQVTVKQISEMTGIKKSIIWDRIRNGWDIERVVEQPVRILKTGGKK